MVNLRLRTPVLVNRCSVWYKSFALQQARDGAHHTFADGKWVFTELLDALEPRAASEGVEIVTVQVVGAKKAPTIRVFIDTPEGVSFDELAKAQAWINDIMDALDPFPGAYTLEVSSPGIDRPLRTEQHFARYAGQQAVVKLAHPIDGRSNFTGTIVSADGGNVVMDVDGQQAVLPIDQMKRAHLKGIVDFSS